MYFSYATKSFSGETSSSSYYQSGSQGFVLVLPGQSNMAINNVEPLTFYPNVLGRGDEDVEKHWYLCEVVWRKRNTPKATKLIEFQTNLRDQYL